VLALALRRTVRSGDVIELVMLAISDQELRRPRRPIGGPTSAPAVRPVPIIRGIRAIKRDDSR